MAEFTVIVVVGASGDLAKRKLYPALWNLYKDGMLPAKTRIVGYGRLDLTVSQNKERVCAHLKASSQETGKIDKFCSINCYLKGSYTEKSAFERLNSVLLEKKTACNCMSGNHLFYLALPPTVLQSVTTNINSVCMSRSGWNRIVVETPLGKDLESSATLTAHLFSLFVEDEIYLMDHYLGKEMVQNLLVMRFANSILQPIWNRDNIACVVITVKEPFGLQGRGIDFDSCGIIREMIQNHLVQLMCLIAMEKPTTNSSEDIHCEKVKVLRHIAPVTLDNTVVGQHERDPNREGEAKPSYVDGTAIPKDSQTPTFAMVCLRITNERWDGVPFILKCGEALNEHEAEICLQFHGVPGDIFCGKTTRNELVIRVQPNEAIAVKMMIKRPGMAFDLVESELGLTYRTRYKGTPIPSAYDRLLLDVLSGEQTSFVSRNELAEAWRIFTPLLHQLEKEETSSVKYCFGSRGPPEADLLMKKNGYLYTDTYK